MPQTLSAIEAAEEAARETAWRYERVTNDVTRLRQDVARLEGGAMDLAPLKKIEALVDDVPASLATHGSQFVPGGFLLKQVLAQLVGDALADGARKTQAERALLAKARKDLAKAEAALKAFDV